MNLTKPQKLLSAGKVAEAEALLPGADSVKSPRLEILRARVKAAAGNIAGAIQTLQAAQNDFPAYPPISLFLGTYLWDEQQYQEAEEAFAAVLAHQPDNDLARSYRALCRFAAGDFATAAAIWKTHGFSDNTIFRVRVAEYIESIWLRDGRFMGEIPDETALRPERKLNTKKALSQFYRRDFPAILPYVPEPPLKDDLAEFLGAVANEMLKHYSRAEAYLHRLQGQRDEWPDPLIALQGRILTRQGKLKEAAAEFSKVLIVGPEDYGVNYYLAIICLAYGLKQEARQYFMRAFTSYMVDTREFQWWQLEQVLLHPDASHPKVMVP